MVKTVFWGMIVFVCLQRTSELVLAESNRRRALRAGGREFGQKHYPVVVLLHSAWLLAWPVEAWLIGLRPGPGWWIWLVLFGVAQIFRYWAILTLGRAWNTRIIVIPGSSRVTSGPYRFLSHPNYVAVVIELLAVPMVFGAWRTAVAASVVNLALLLFVRIPVENRALQGLRG